MPEFVSPNPDARVRGAVFLSYLQALGDEARPYVEKHGFSNIEPRAWYNYQATLELLKDLSTTDMQGTFDLVRVGMRACEIVLQRFQSATLEEYLMRLAESQKDFFEGLDMSQWWQIDVLPKQIVVKVSTFTGCDFSYGYLYAAARHLRPANNLFSVTHREGACRKKGDDFCVYDVKWWEEDPEIDYGQFLV